MRMYSVVFLFFALVSMRAFPLTYAQEVIDDISFHHSTGMNIINNKHTITSPYYSETITTNATSAYYDTYMLYEMIYKQFFFSIAPQYKLQESENYLLLKEAEVSYAFNTVIVGVSKTIEPRTLSRHKDYLSVAHRDIGYNDAFSFWKTNVLIPLEFVSIEIGSKFIREEYKLEWEHWDDTLMSNFVYFDTDWKRWSVHTGYAYQYDIDTEQSASHYTFKLLFSYDSIVELYAANLLVQDYNKSTLTWNDYSFVLGTGFSLASAMGLQAEILDVRLDAELIFEEEAYSIAPSLGVVYKIISTNNTLRYHIENDEIVNIASIALNIQAFTFSIYDVYAYDRENGDYNNILGMEVTFDM